MSWEHIEAVVADACARGKPRRRAMMLAGLGTELVTDIELPDAVLASFTRLPAADGVAPEIHLRVACLDAATSRQLQLSELPLNGVVECSPDGQIVVHLQQQSVAVLNRHTATITALMNAAGEASQRAKPLQLSLSILCADRGIDFLHAGMVASRGNAILLVGKGGSGKSTMSIAAMLDGMDYLGDDCVAVHHIAARFLGHAVFGTGCLEWQHLENFPGLALTEPSGERKALLPVAGLANRSMATAVRIRAVVVPRYTGIDHIEVRPIARRDVLLALAPSSILKRAVPATATLSRMATLVRELPCYAFEMGPVREIGSNVRQLIEELAND